MFQTPDAPFHDVDQPLRCYTQHFRIVIKFMQLVFSKGWAIETMAYFSCTLMGIRSGKNCLINHEVEAYMIICISSLNVTSQKFCTQGVWVQMILFGVVGSLQNSSGNQISCEQTVKEDLTGMGYSDVIQKQFKARLNLTIRVC